MKTLKLVSDLNQSINQAGSHAEIQEIKNSIVNHKKANRIYHLDLFRLMQQVGGKERSLTQNTQLDFLTSKESGVKLYL